MFSVDVAVMGKFNAAAAGVLAVYVAVGIFLVGEFDHGDLVFTEAALIAG